MAEHRLEGNDGAPAANGGQETAGPGIAELPDDMMVAIFMHLDVKTQLMVVPSVCKSWARIHRHQMPPARLVFGSGGGFSAAQTATLTDAEMLGIARRVRLLGSLDLTGCDSVTPFGLKRVLGIHPSITQLTLGRKLATHSVVATLGMCCPKLVELGLTSDLVLLPAEIGQLTGLQSLDLSDCEQLGSVPVEIGQLTGLHTLDLSYCEQLASLPTEIGQLTGLQTLNLSFCRQLASLPAEIGQLTGLQTLNLCYCTQLASYLSCCEQLGSLAAEIAQLTGLRVLSLDARLRGNLPDELVQTLTANGTTL